MVHSGVWSITFENIFSDSSYSNECSNSIARVKSFLDFSSQVVSKSTDPNCASGGPQEITSPFFNPSSPITSLDGAEFLLLHDSTMREIKDAYNKIREGFIRQKFLQVSANIQDKGICFAVILPLLWLPLSVNLRQEVLLNFLPFLVDDTIVNR